MKPTNKIRLLEFVEIEDGKEVSWVDPVFEITKKGNQIKVRSAYNEYTYSGDIDYIVRDSGFNNE